MLCYKLDFPWVSVFSNTSASFRPSYRHDLQRLSGARSWGMAILRYRTLPTTTRMARTGGLYSGHPLRIVVSRRAATVSDIVLP